MGRQPSASLFAQFNTLLLPTDWSCVSGQPTAMSGEQIRYDATYGLHDHLRDILKTRANTAEADDLTLTPLMYAVWNGHTECVRYLVCNDVGVDAKGNKVSALHMTSIKGYTALHLAGLDCPADACKDITTLLLVAGLDPACTCNYDKTAADLAREALPPNQPFLDALEAFEGRGTDEVWDKALNSLKQLLLDKYTFIHNPTMMVQKWKADFKVPSYVFDNHRVGELPEGLHIHEHLIPRLIDEGYSVKTGVDALKCIDFARGQANANEKRRNKLLQADPSSDWQPVDLEAVYAGRMKKVKRGAKRQEKDGDGQAAESGADAEPGAEAEPGRGHK